MIYFTIDRYADKNCINQSQLPPYQSPYVKIYIGKHRKGCFKGNSTKTWTAVIVGTVVPVGVIIVSGIIVAVVIILKKRRMNANQMNDDENDEGGVNQKDYNDDDDEFNEGDVLLNEN